MVLMCHNRYMNEAANFYFDNAYRTGSDIWSHIPYHKEITRVIDSLPIDNPYILELGVGHGLSLLPLKHTRHKLFGIDTNEQVIKELRENIKHHSIKNMGVLVGNAEQVPFHDKSFDLICDGGILTYAQDSEMVNIFSEIERVLKPDGYYLHVSYSTKTSKIYGYTPNKDDLFVQEFTKFGVMHRMYPEKYLKNRYLRNFNELFHEEYLYDSRTDPGEELVITLTGFQKK